MFLVGLGIIGAREESAQRLRPQGSFSLLSFLSYSHALPSLSLFLILKSVFLFNFVHVTVLMSILISLSWLREWGIYPVRTSSTRTFDYSFQSAHRYAEFLLEKMLVKIFRCRQHAPSLSLAHFFSLTRSPFTRTNFVIDLIKFL